MRETDHYLVDFDGVLAETVDTPGPDQIGAPIPSLIRRVKIWRESGIEVRIFTARVSTEGGKRRALVQQERAAIETWCLEHLGEVLPITCEKSWRTARIYDDRAWRVEQNTGRILHGEPA